MALILFPSVAAEPESLSGTVSFSTARLGGLISFAPDTPGAAIEVRPGRAPERFSWSLDAEEITLQWIKVMRSEVGDPFDPADPYLYYQREAPKRWKENLGRVTLHSESQSEASDLLIYGENGGANLESFVASELSLSPTRRNQWHAGTDGSPPIGGDDEQETRVTFDVPPGSAVGAATDVAARMTGDFIVAVWDADVVVRDEEGERVVSSGKSSREMIPPSSGVASVKETEYNLLVLVVRNGSMLLETVGDNLRVAAPAFALIGEGRGVVDAVSGEIRHQGSSSRITSESITLQGTFELGVLSRDRDRFTADFRVLSGAITTRDYEAVTVSMTNVAPSKPYPPVAWTVLILLPLGIFAAMRLVPISVEDVEKAVLEGRVQRARRLAKRLVRQNPKDPDAIFLLATTLLMEGRFRTLLAKIETMAARIPQRNRSGIAFTLATAAHALGDAARVRRWAQEAAREPALMHRMRKDGVWPVKTAHGPSPYA